MLVSSYMIPTLGLRLHYKTIFSVSVVSLSESVALEGFGESSLTRRSSRRLPRRVSNKFPTTENELTASSPRKRDPGGNPSDGQEPALTDDELGKTAAWRRERN